MLAARTPRGQASPLRIFLETHAAEVVCALVAVALYLPSLGFGFVFDDAALIGADGAPIAVGGALPYRPLRYASYLVDGWLGGSAAVYHAHNVLLHAAVCALVVAIARRLGAAGVAALAAGLVVACHPIAVESVAYVAGRRDLLCVALGLAAVLSRLDGRRGIALVLLVAAGGAKESGLVFAAPIFAIELAESAGGVAVVAAAGAGVALALAYGAIGPWHPPVDLAGLALPGRVAAHYLSGLAGVRALAPEYPALAAGAQNEDALPAMLAITATLVVLFAAFASLLACRSTRDDDRAAAVANAWLAASLAALALWGGLHEPGVDRHAYVLLPAGAVAVCVAATRLRTRLRVSSVPPLWAASLRTLAAAAAVLTIASCAREASDQMQIWSSERALWSGAARSPLATPRAHANLARALALDGEYAAATVEMNAALAKDPADPLLLLSRAAVRCAAGRGTLARRDLRRAARAGAESERVAALATDCAAVPHRSS